MVSKWCAMDFATIHSMSHPGISGLVAQDGIRRPRKEQQRTLPLACLLLPGAPQNRERRGGPNIYLCINIYPPKTRTPSQDSLVFVGAGSIHILALHYITLHCITLHCTLHYTTLHYITLHCIVLHSTTLHNITLHYNTLHYMTHIYVYIYCSW